MILRELIDYYFGGLGSIFMMLFVPESVMLFCILTGLVINRYLKRRRRGGGGGGSDFTLRPDGPPGATRALPANPALAFQPGLWIWHPPATRPTSAPTNPTAEPTPASTPNCTAV